MAKIEPTPMAQQVRMLRDVAGVTMSISYAAVVGFTVKTLREIYKLTQVDLSSMTKITQSALSRIEVGESVVDVDQLRAIATAFHRDPHEILSAADAVAALLEANAVEISRKKDSEPGTLLFASHVPTVMQQLKASVIATKALQRHRR